MVLKDIREWMETDEKEIVAPCMGRIRELLPRVRCVSRFGSRYYGVGLATYDFDLCLLMCLGISDATKALDFSKHLQKHRLSARN